MWAETTFLEIETSQQQQPKCWKAKTGNTLHGAVKQNIKQRSTTHGIQDADLHSSLWRSDAHATSGRNRSKMIRCLPAELNADEHKFAATESRRKVQLLPSDLQCQRQKFSFGASFSPRVWGTEVRPQWGPGAKHR